MTPRDIFCLIVRLSGYFAALFAAYIIIAIVLGPVDYSFMGFFRALTIPVAYGALGVLILKVTPKIAAFTYGGS